MVLEGGRVEDRRNDIWVDKAVAYIKLRKKALGISQAELAKLVDVSEDTIREFFRGEVKNPRFFTICEIVRVLGGSLDEMMELTPVKQIDNVPTAPTITATTETSSNTEIIALLKDERQRLWDANKRLILALGAVIAAVVVLFGADVLLNDMGWFK